MTYVSQVHVSGLFLQVLSYVALSILYEKKEEMLLKRVCHGKPHFSKASFEAPEEI